MTDTIYVSKSGSIYSFCSRNIETHHSAQKGQIRDVMICLISIHGRVCLNCNLFFFLDISGYNWLFVVAWYFLSIILEHKNPSMSHSVLIEMDVFSCTFSLQVNNKRQIERLKFSVLLNPPYKAQTWLLIPISSKTKGTLEGPALQLWERCGLQYGNGFQTKTDFKTTTTLLEVYWSVWWFCTKKIMQLWKKII